MLALGRINNYYKRYGLYGMLANFLYYKYEMHVFNKKQFKTISNIEKSELTKQFHFIDRKIECAHSPFQFFLIASHILDLNIEGPIVECGCYKGGSSAKLSILAKHLNKKLYIFDSFEGLPPDYANEEYDGVGFKNAKYESEKFHPGDYKGSLEEVEENIRNYGCLEFCELIPGFFEKSLPLMDIKPSIVFIDVDLINSARTCLKYLWPKLSNGGFWFTHEAIFENYIYGILNSKWWHDNLQECPPIIIGAGTGLSPVSGGIAYMKKDHTIA